MLFPLLTRRSIRWALTPIWLFYLVEAEESLRGSYSHNNLLGIVWAALWVVLGIGLWKFHPAARVVSLVLHLFLFIFTPLAILFQRLIHDYPPGHPPRTTWPFVISAFLFSAMNGYVAYILASKPFSLVARQSNSKSSSTR